MRNTLPPNVERRRVKTGIYGSDSTYGPTGMFHLKGDQGATLAVIASSGEETGWEHVSVSLPNRCPSWTEMAMVKESFWEDHETVLQLHPPRSEYVNNHPFCLHLWRPVAVEIPLPPRILVGVKELGTLPAV